MEHNKGVYNILGIGLGPSNLSLAIALYEDNFSEDFLFLEQKADFSWHPGMLIPDATIQKPFLKDLVTLHNPQSQFSFLNFLKEQNRLQDFVALREFFPTRKEFSEYFKWAAGKLSNHIAYGKTVTGIYPHGLKNGNIDLVEVQVLDNMRGSYEIYLARNVVIVVGAEPAVLKLEKQMGGKIFHAQNFIPCIDKLSKDQDGSVLIVGAGQSAAEITCYFLEQYNKLKVSVISRNFIFHSLDENPLINKLYSHPSSKDFYNLSSDAKKMFMDSLSLSNYSAADNDLIRRIAKQAYKNSINREDSLSIYPFCEVKKIEEENEKYTVTFYDKLHSTISKKSFDIVCLATGYSSYNVIPLLEGIKKHIKLKDKEYDLCEHYKIRTSENFLAGVYLQNYSSKTHGFIEGTLADLSGRAQTILSNVKIYNQGEVYVQNHSFC